MYALRNVAARRTPLAISQRAGLHQSAVRMAGKESKLHSEGRAEEAEKQKQESLSDQKAGKGQWKEGLASDSESAVKADRGESKSTEETIKELQEEAKKASK